MLLADFQDSIWTHVFASSGSKLENLERNGSNSEEECNYEKEILSSWHRIPDTFSEIKNIEMDGFVNNVFINLNV